MKKFFLYVLLFLPVVAALGYDTYIYYSGVKDPYFFTDTNKLLNPAPHLKAEEPFFFSDLGWIWQHHSKESHDELYNTIGKENWGLYFEPVLSLPAVVAGALLSGTIVAIILIVKLFSSAFSSQFTPRKSAPGGGLGRDRGGTKKFEYKRK